MNLRNYIATWALNQGDAKAALEHVERTLQVARDTELRHTEMEMLGLRALTLCECARAPEALADIRAARAIFPDPQPPKLAFHYLMLEAYAQLKLEDRQATHALLRQGLAIAREHGYIETYAGVPRFLATLCAEALAAGIETTHVRHIIRAWPLKPPPQPEHTAVWPWAIKVFVLGRFDVQLDGEPLVFSGKAQKKPLALLKLLIARGPAPVEQSYAAQELWPDSEGDAADSALRMALHRLRKLLGADEAILATESKLQLNPALCWVDAWAFEHAARTLEADADASQPVAAAQSLLQLYPGEAFAAETLQPWMLAARDRLRSKFLRAVRTCGAACERSAAWQEAAAIYEAGIAADPLCEEFYQALIECHLKRGQNAEAFGVYRRCRDMLSITLGIKPSAKTEALREKIALQGAA